MDFDSFLKSLEADTPPAGLDALLEALWWDARGDWDRAHRIAQDIHTSAAAWVHAYLHRKEGDLWNAGYWYRQAGREMPDCSLEEEWRRIAKALL
ncbi:MAG: hypothetical protein KatS3mg029_0819 [Saprospiraceae bacterium]|nr:MAG: hypothetical protein KatS3mg029_0819 [Saprospiraceae bacterium]